ncbi:Zn-dependent alcohol dehydrogenase, class III [Saccharomonospora marina XMU15]|uniref:Zn-dependent alcohol dehydrogenase, class III n=1 Tax=Saccharomonospora marina XMU15 TaxID=882083 RepID=H5X858_9PSEU|nr:Zn-dependent alcohol dehydrogenase [Saccharomonospora marina]EHR53590.1 Zn-dependent alcohol dehydrogenase, class III [Saccharomonospora marina XMU15]
MVKAVIVDEQGAPPRIADLELPAAGPNDVRVRVAATGVCHSDLSMVDGTLAPRFPLVLGHEAAGTVVEAGAAVTSVGPGDRVVLNWAPACRHCWFCLHGEPWLCSAVEGVASVPRGHLADGTQAHVCMGVGALAEEVVLPATAVVPLPETVPLDLAALLGCAVLTGIGAVRNTAGVRSGESVLVVGLGGIGLSAVLGARLAGAGPIVAVDVAREKEELALRAGATHFLLSEPKLARQVRGLTGGRGADHAFDCVGAPATIRSAWSSVRRGGSCTVVGIGRRDAEVTFNPLELFHFSRTLTSSVYGASDPSRDVALLAGQIELGRLDLSLLVTHRITPEAVGEAFRRMRAGEGARSLVEWAGR